MVDAGGDLLGKEDERQRRIAEEKHHRRHSEGKGDRHAGDNAKNKAGQHQCGGQRAEPGASMQAKVARGTQQRDNGGAG
ncbi:hypothetical protein D3C80_893570 [compost metagenome]